MDKKDYFEEETAEIVKRLNGYISDRPKIMFETDEGTEDHMIYIASSYYWANDENCRSCKFYDRYTYDCGNHDNFDWEPTQEITCGKCRRYPPQFQEHGKIGYQPTVENFGWCGEYVRASEHNYINGAHGISASALKDG